LVKYLQNQTGTIDLKLLVVEQAQWNLDLRLYLQKLNYQQDKYAEVLVKLAYSTPALKSKVYNQDRVISYLPAGHH